MPVNASRKSNWVILLAATLAIAIVAFFVFRVTRPGTSRLPTLPTFGCTLTVTHDGRIVAVGDSYGEIQLLSLSNWNPLSKLQTDSGGFWFLAFSPDGRTLVSGGYERQLCIWDVATGTQIKKITDFGEFVSCGAFSLDGKYLAVGGEESKTGGKLTLYDAVSWKVINSIEGLPSRVENVAFAPDSGDIAAKIANGPVRMWNSLLSAELKSFDVSSSGSALQFSSDGKLLFLQDQTYFDDSTIHKVVALDPQSGEEILAVPTGVGQIALSSDGQLLAVALGRQRGSIKAIMRGLGRMEVYGIPSGQLVASYEESGYIESPQFIPNSHTLVATGGVPGKSGRIYEYHIQVKQSDEKK